jgi:transcriptional regulator with XRE-family HTH domain
MNIKIKFWNRVRDLRKKQGLSQEKLAEKCKLHRTYIWIIERWEKNVSLENIEILANALKVDLKDLFLKL